MNTLLKSMLLLPALIVFAFAHTPVYSQGKIVKSDYSDTLEQNAVTRAQVDSVFNFIASQNQTLDFSDCNICKSRAHIIARAIEKKFEYITTGKAWLFAASNLSSKREYYRTHREVWLQHKNICEKWGYHVAPVIITESDTFVIDPATQNSPVKLTDWASALVPPDGEALLVIKQNIYYIFPDDNYDLFEDKKAAWYDEDEKIKWFYEDKIIIRYDEEENLFDRHFSRSIDEMVRASLGFVEPWKMNERVKKIKKLIE